MSVPLDQDPRWQKLRDRAWTCRCCGELHNGLFDLACDKPDFWKGDDERRSNSEVLTSDNVLTEDFCVLSGEHFFVRCVLRLPIIGTADDHFAYGVWATLSKKNFDIYLDHFDAGDAGDLGPWFGWFSNRLPGYPDTLNLKCQVHPQATASARISNSSRPIIRSRSSSNAVLHWSGCWRSTPSPDTTYGRRSYRRNRRAD